MSRRYDYNTIYASFLDFCNKTGNVTPPSFGQWMILSEHQPESTLTSGEGVSSREDY